ncbi:MAG: hypothetical protein LC687_00845 [Actinobacteria bacterium]|nr:hypothetical protein [Actinomycetota bacterium]MCA1806403.1 hypothetical protein [Actinomycetota bacterium]
MRVKELIEQLSRLTDEEKEYHVVFETREYVHHITMVETHHVEHYRGYAAAELTPIPKGVSKDRMLPAIELC